MKAISIFAIAVALAQSALALPTPDSQTSSSCGSGTNVHVGGSASVGDGSTMGNGKWPFHPSLRPFGGQGASSVAPAAKKSNWKSGDNRLSASAGGTSSGKNANAGGSVEVSSSGSSGGMGKNNDNNYGQDELDEIDDMFGNESEDFE